jgi:predicted ATPase
LRVRHEDWGEAPDARGLVGRVAARATLRQWVLTDRCRAIALLGLGGIGKTVLAARLAQEVAADFELVFWRSLRNAPTLSEWFASAIDFLSEHMLVAPDGNSARREMLLKLLRERRCLVVLDNFETVLGSDVHTAGAQHDEAGFADVVRMLAESSHQSCVLLTSREGLVNLDPLVGETAGYGR